MKTHLIVVNDPLLYNVTEYSIDKYTVYNKVTSKSIESATEFTQNDLNKILSIL